MQTHLLHPVVLILGVLFAIRRMDVSMRTAEQYPGVEAEAFDRWKRLAMGGYGLGMAASFGKVLLDFAFAYLFFRIYAPAAPVRLAIGLTLDVGHCLATGEGEPHEILREHAGDLLVLQLDDHRRGVHDHLAFGEGEVDFSALARAVHDVRFEGPLEVELSRHASTAPMTAEKALVFLRRVFGT